MARIERLERQNRFQRLLLLTAGIVTVVVAFLTSATGSKIAAAPAQADTIRGRRFELVDEKGDVCMVIGNVQGQTMFTMSTGKEDSSEIHFGVHASNPYFALYGPRKDGEQARVEMDAGTDAHLKLSSRSGVRCELASDQGIGLFDSKGELGVEASMREGGSRTVSVYAPGHDSFVHMRGDASNGSGVSVFSKESYRAGMFVRPNNTLSVLTLNNRRGDSVFRHEAKD